MKIFFRNIHLYLSLGAGLIIAVLCLTGAVLVFEKELEQAWHPERYSVTALAGAATPLPLARLSEAVQAYKPGATISGVKVYADANRTVEFSLAGATGGEGQAGNKRPAEGASEKNGQPGKGKAGEKGGEGGGPKVFVNPYTAAVTGELNYRETVFFTVMALHRGMVGGAAGKLVVGISTVMFLFIIGTGLVLWWPATRKAVSQRMQVKWSGGWKRLNHDLHIVLGFYSALFLFVFAFTGLAWSFEWFNKGIYAVTNSPLQRPEPPTSLVLPATAPAQPGLTPDAALARARELAPGAVSYALQLPKDATGSIRVATLRPDAAYENATDEVFLDQYSGQVLRQQTYEQRNLGQRVRGMFKPVHTGAVFGWPSKIIGLVTCVLGFTFPITGTIMWLNRLRKQRRKARKLVSVAG